MKMGESLIYILIYIPGGVGMRRGPLLQMADPHQPRVYAQEVVFVSCHCPFRSKIDMHANSSIVYMAFYPHVNVRKFGVS